MVKGVDAGIMPVIPVNTNCVGTYFLDVEYFKDRLVHLKGIFRGSGIVGFLGLRAVGPRAARTGTLIAQVGKRVFTSMTVLPVDLDSFGFGNCDMFG